MSVLIGMSALPLLVINMIFWCTLLLLVGIIRLLIPINFWRQITTKITILIGECCIYCNNSWINILHRPNWNVEGLEFVDRGNWYLAISNHQSWADIFLLQYITNRKIPLLRFFMKDVLKWIPIVWIVGWSMNMPFLKRYSEETLRKYPELKGKDISTMKTSFEKLSVCPGTVFSFAEGTRFSEQKQKNQRPTFDKLLKPKAGGIAITIATMPYIKNLVDFTISYKSKSRSFWDFLCGRMSEASIRVEIIEIPKEFFEKDYSHNEKYRESLKNWLYSLWKKKEQFLKD